MKTKASTLDLRLDRSVQFLYEAALAVAELRALGCERVVRDEVDWRLIRAHVNGNAEGLRTRSAYMGLVGKAATDYSHLTRPRYQGGEFNRTRSANQYLTHWIYPYRGKFHPQMVRGLFNILGAKPGMTAADFFLGSGTSALEASLLGLDFIGSDLSPLCVLLTRVKTQSHAVAGEIDEAATKLLARKKLTLEHVREHPHSDSRVADFFEIACMVTLSDSARRKREVESSLRKNIAAMAESVRAHNVALERFAIRPGNVSVSLGDARNLRPSIQDGSVDVIVTSPPYSIALDYVENDEHALKALGEDADKLRRAMTGVRGSTPKEKMALYNADMKLVFQETARVLAPKGRAAFVIGDATVDGQECTTTHEMQSWASDAGLRLEQSIDKIVFGLYSVMKDEKILIFQRTR